MGETIVPAASHFNLYITHMCVDRVERYDGVKWIIERNVIGDCTVSVKECDKL